MINIIKENKLAFLILLVVFIISANIAWLNPAPGKESYRPHNDIPLLWQYNYDSGIEILTAAYFPKIFNTDTTRIDRPTYPFVSNLIGKIIGFILNPVYKLSELEKAGAGYIILKLLVYFSAIILMYLLLKDFLDKKIILYAQFLTFFSVISISNATTFHTIELQFITPIYILFLFRNILKNYSLTKNFIFSFLIGILMLAKPNYATYLAIILFLLFEKKFLEVFISVFAHFVPLLLYIFYLRINNFTYFFVGFEHGHGIWLFRDFIFLNPIEMIQTIFFSFNNFIKILFLNFHIWIFLFIIGFYLLYENKNYKILKLISICILCNWVQCFVSDRYNVYMTSDLMIFIYPLAVYFACKFLSNLNNSNLATYIVNISIIYVLLSNILAFVNFPWIHPKNQVAKDPNRIEHRHEEVIRN